ncbi:MAG TPA: hypothetical protein VG652_04780 [Gaiellaceae bacterium]|nr:hypothetical protein [Gaiellaceae bacterium]
MYGSAGHGAVSFGNGKDGHVLEKLKSLFGGARRQAEDYNLTASERKEAESLRERGPEGVRELTIEHQADRRFDAEEGRPPEE